MFCYQNIKYYKSKIMIFTAQLCFNNIAALAKCFYSELYSE